MSNRQADKITVYDVIQGASEAGEWVNGEFEAIVSNPTQGQGRKPSKCRLSDPDNHSTHITGAWFSGDFTKMDGCRVLVGGQSLKAKIYRGETELAIGDKGLVNIVQRGAAPAHQPAAHNGGASSATTGNAQKAPAAAAQTPAQMLNKFHATMKRTALLLLHSRQYAKDIEAKEGGPMPADQFQATVSSLFITAKDKGLLDIVPAPRAIDPSTKLAVAFVPVKDAADPEAEAKAKEEAAARLKREEEAAAKRRQQEALDEDVPF